MPPPPSDSTDWFNFHVKPHERLLRAWLQSRFPSETDVDDIVQESYLRVIKARQRIELRSPKAFLFRTAGNLALDFLKRRRVRREEPIAHPEALSLEDGSESIPETAAKHQLLALVNEAVQALPERCRQIFTLRKMHGLSRKEIAARLGISENTVAAQLGIALNKCADYVERRTSERDCTS